ncbi:MAG: thiamine pyrophosphate-binding protein [Acidimicrobiales bacterium]
MTQPVQSRDGGLHTGGDAVVDVLEWAGVEVVFGIPSVHNLPTYDALKRRGTIRAITVRHEQAAAAAADGYARVTGKLGVFLTSTGPGAANAMGGQLEAFVSGSPVLHLTGQIETRHLDRGRGFIHEVPHQPAMLASLSKQVFRAEKTDSIAATVAEAADLAMTAPQGPVSVELPIDLQYAEANPEAWHPAADFGHQSLKMSRPAAWVKAAEMISQAHAPLIWAGGGAVRAHAEEEVVRLARRIGAGLITSANARGLLPEDDPMCIGNLPWDPQVRELVMESDLLIGIGTRYQGPNTENWKMEMPASIIQIDVDPRVPGRNYRAAVEAKGDAKEVVAYVLRHLEQMEPWVSKQDPAWLNRVTAVATAARARLRGSLGAQEALLDELAPLVTADTVVVKDSTIPAYTWGNRLLPVRRTRTAIMPNGFAIGLGLAHAIGAAVGSDGTPVVCMVGDGGFMLTVAELATIAEERLPVVVALFNDGGYGILRNIQDRQYDRRIGVDLGSPDFTALAKSLGVDAERVETPAAFGKAMKQALGSGKPFLVEVDLDSIGPMRRPYTGTSRPPEGLK